MDNYSRKAKRVVLDGPNVKIEFEDGGITLRVAKDRDEAIRDAAACAAQFGTYVHDTAKQEALSFLP